MIRTKIQVIDGKDLFYCQIESGDKQPSDVPAGLTFFWELGDKKILSPGDIVSMIQNSIMKDNSAVKTLISKDSVKAHYDNLYKQQMAMLDKGFEDIIAETAKIPGIPTEFLNSIRRQKDAMKATFPDVDGSFKPTPEQATEILGNDAIRTYYQKEEIQRLFGGKR